MQPTSKTNEPKRVEKVSEERQQQARTYFEQAAAGDRSRWGTLWSFQKEIKKGWKLLGFNDREIARIKINKPDWV